MPLSSQVTWSYVNFFKLWPLFVLFTVDIFGCFFHFFRMFSYIFQFFFFSYIYFLLILCLLREMEQKKKTNVRKVRKKKKKMTPKKCTVNKTKRGHSLKQFSYTCLRSETHRNGCRKFWNMYSKIFMSSIPVL